MMPEGLTVQAVQAMVTSFIAVAAAAAALSSFLLCRTTLAERAGLAAGATLLLFPQWSPNLAGAALNRKSVVTGKMVPVRLDLGGRRNLKNKTHTNITHID